MRTVEQYASMILGEVSEKEYLSRRVIGGSMPWLNQVFEEMEVTYGDRKIPDKVLKYVEEKAAKAANSSVCNTLKFDII